MEYNPVPQAFHTGDCFDAYRFLGAHPSKGGGWSFRVWAPGAQKVFVQGDFNGWANTDELEKTPSGVFRGVVQNAQAGQLYKLNILGQDGHWVLRPDPYASETELRPGTASRLCDLSAVAIDDADWCARRDKHYDLPLNIYEMHAGSWKHRPEDDSWYNYEELAAELIPWLKEHGYTHVEFLPLSEHVLDASWGYQTTGYFSVTSRYGTPAQFAALVEALHKAGIGVIMDFVPVHFIRNADILARFDGSPLYEYDSDVGQSEWGTCNFNFYRGEVRSFLNSAAAFWLDVFHCDGIRMDAISNAIYWMGDSKRGVNPGAVTFLQKMNTGLHELSPNAMLIAEDSTNFLKVTAPVPYDGLGFDYKWDMGWMHDTLDYFATPFGERQGAYHKITFSMSYFQQELYLLALSHDEVVHGKKTIIDKIWGTPEEKWAQARTLYFYMYMHPGKKLNFMGGELAHFREWDEDRELDWLLLKYPLHDAFQHYIAELARLYESEPALYAGEYDNRRFEWVDCSNPLTGVYAWLRKDAQGDLLCVMNTQNVNHRAYPLHFESACTATELLGSEWDTWGGCGLRNAETATHPGGVPGRRNTLRVDLPPMGACLFRLEKSE